MFHFIDCGKGLVVYVIRGISRRLAGGLGRLKVCSGLMMKTGAFVVIANAVALPVTLLGSDVCIASIGCRRISFMVFAPILF
jgi:hypothetical protein